MVLPSYLRLGCFAEFLTFDHFLNLILLCFFSIVRIERKTLSERSSFDK